MYPVDASNYQKIVKVINVIDNFYHFETLAAASKHQHVQLPSSFYSLVGPTLVKNMSVVYAVLRAVVSSSGPGGVSCTFYRRRSHSLIINIACINMIDIS